jgi:hypothetical protein
MSSTLLSAIASDISYTSLSQRLNHKIIFDEMSDSTHTFSDPYTQQTSGPAPKNFADLSNLAAQLMDEVKIPNVGKIALK